MTTHTTRMPSAQKTIVVMSDRPSVLALAWAVSVLVATMFVIRVLGVGGVRVPGRWPVVSVSTISCHFAGGWIHKGSVGWGGGAGLPGFEGEVNSSWATVSDAFCVAEGMGARHLGCVLNLKHAVV